MKPNEVQEELLATFGTVMIVLVVVLMLIGIINGMNTYVKENTGAAEMGVKYDLIIEYHNEPSEGVDRTQYLFVVKEGKLYPLSHATPDEVEAEMVNKLLNALEDYANEP